MKLKPALLFLFSAILLGCTSEHPLKLKFEFLEGHWVSEQGTDTRFYESWSWSGSEWKGRGSSVEQGDTLLVEEMRIFSTSGGIYLTANTGGEDGEVAFRLEHDTLGIYIFRNPEHDYPSEIGYEYLESDSLRAWIGGTQGQFDWAFTRNEDLP